MNRWKPAVMARNEHTVKTWRPLKMNVNCFVIQKDYLYIQTVVLFQFLAKILMKMITTYEFSLTRMSDLNSLVIKSIEFNSHWIIHIMVTCCLGRQKQDQSIWHRTKKQTIVLNVLENGFEKKKHFFVGPLTNRD